MNNLSTVKNLSVMFPSKTLKEKNTQISLYREWIPMNINVEKLLHQFQKIYYA